MTRKKRIIRAESWEGDEYVITLDGRPIGRTLHRTDAKLIINWLNTADELVLYLKKRGRSTSETSHERPPQICGRV
jgi:hypothetical protein